MTGVGDRALAVVVKIDRIEPWLDDALLDLTTLCDLGTELAVTGNRAGYLGSRRLRFPVRFLFHQVSASQQSDHQARHADAVQRGPAYARTAR